jgi:hypothetical protein
VGLIRHFGDILQIVLFRLIFLFMMHVEFIEGAVISRRTVRAFEGLPLHLLVFHFVIGLLQEVELIVDFAEIRRMVGGVAVITHIDYVHLIGRMRQVVRR